MLDYERFLDQDYVIINPMKVYPDQYEDLESICLVPKGMERHERLMPLLISLKTLSNFERMELADRSNRWQKDYGTPLFSGLLRSVTSQHSIQVHWQRMTICRRLSPWTRAWLRMHDSRVFRHLCWILEPRQLVILMGPIEYWSWYDPIEEKWNVQKKPLIKNSAVSGLDLSERQWAMLEEIEGLNMCLKEIYFKNKDVSAVPDNKLLIDDLLKAKSLGLRDREDRCLYTLHQYLYGQQVHEVGPLHDCLEQAQKGEVSYVGACAALPQEFFDAAAMHSKMR